MFFMVFNSTGFSFFGMITGIYDLYSVSTATLSLSLLIMYSTIKLDFFILDSSNGGLYPGGSIKLSRNFPVLNSIL